MIPVTPAAEPPDFDRKVRQPGLLAIAEQVGERPSRAAGQRFQKVATRREDIPASKFHPYWTESLHELLSAYDRVCAYSCFGIHKVTGANSVDHFAPKSKQWDQVYEWSNYRLACAKLNSRKNNYEDVLDPFEIKEGWFQLELVGFQIIPNPELSQSRRKKIEATVVRLGLDDFKEDRAADAEEYWRGDVSLQKLRKESPFVARELIRQHRLLEHDRNL